jgi:hypothetical protein
MSCPPKYEPHFVELTGTFPCAHKLNTVDSQNQKPQLAKRDTVENLRTRNSQSTKPWLTVESCISNLGLIPQTYYGTSTYISCPVGFHIYTSIR